MGQFVCDGTCAGNELGDCNHGELNDGLGGKKLRAEHPESAWNDGYDQAVEEVLSEVAERSPTMYRAIMNKYPAWKAIIAAARDR